MELRLSNMVAAKGMGRSNESLVCLLIIFFFSHQRCRPDLFGAKRDGQNGMHFSLAIGKINY